LGFWGTGFKRRTVLKVKKESAAGKHLVIGKVILLIIFLIHKNKISSLLGTETFCAARLGLHGPPIPFSKSSIYFFITTCKNRAENERQKENSEIIVRVCIY
jgi:hypothetical protein